MRVFGLMSGVGRALVVVSTVPASAALGVVTANADGPVHVRSRLGDACLDAPSWIGDVPVVINPDGQVTTDVGNCLTVFGGPAPGTRASARWCNGDPGQGWDSAP
ncbi:MAG: hypothetical protein QOC63_4782 [Mycobacterium sp.]|jgi:hypothetical protein|nr:hypothetical protein [Mycobacterium sp.]